MNVEKKPSWVHGKIYLDPDLPDQIRQAQEFTEDDQSHFPY